MNPVLKFFKKGSHIAWLATTLVATAVAITANILTDENNTDGFYNIICSTELGGKIAQTQPMEDGMVFNTDEGISSKKDALENAKKVSTEICEEGMVLLKNENNALPLKKNAKVSVFGKNSVNLVYGGSGSAAPGGNEEKKTIFDSLTAAGFSYNKKLEEFYKDNGKSGEPRPGNPGMDDQKNGKAPSLSTGETYGTLVTKYLEQENDMFKGIDLNDGHDAWYDPERAVAFMELAKDELGDSVKEWPVHLDIVEDGTDEQGKNMALAMQKSIEDAIGDYVKIDLNFMDNSDQRLDSYYNVERGEDNSMDVAFGAGWGPDYGDPYTYIHCFDADNGDMLLYSGITPIITEDTERPESQKQALEAIGLTEIKALMDQGNAAFGDERIDLFAQVEAKLLANGILRPFATRGAGLQVSKVKPFSGAYGLYGQASTNVVPYFKYMEVYDEPVTADEYYAAKEAWLNGD